MDKLENPAGSGGSRPGVPKLTKDLYPTTGGWVAEDCESDGAPGEKGEAGGSNPTGNTTEGDYVSPAGTIGGYPHGTEDAILEGPAIGTTVGPNGDVDMGDRSPGGHEPNQPLGPKPNSRPVSV